MKFFNFIKNLLQENTGLRDQNNEIDSEIRSILNYPQLSDCIIEEYERECLQKLNDFHNGANDLEIDIDSNCITFKVNGKEEELYSYRNSNKIKKWEIKRAVKKYLDKTTTISILSFNLDIDDSLKKELVPILDYLLYDYKKTLLIHKTGVNEELDRYCLGLHNPKNYVQYFYKRNNIQYCAYFISNCNFLSFIDRNWNYAEFNEVANYLYVRAENSEKYNEIEEIYKNEKISLLYKCFEMYVRTIKESFVSDCIKMNFLNKRTEVLNMRLIKIMKTDSEFSDKANEYIRSLKVKKQEKYKKFFVRECTCRMKDKMEQILVESFDSHSLNCKINTHLKKSTENTKKTLFGRIIYHIYNNHYSLIEKHKNELFQYLFPEKFFIKCADLLSGLKLISYWRILLYNTEKEDLNENIKVFILDEIHKGEKEFYKSKISIEIKSIVKDSVKNIRNHREKLLDRKRIENKN